MVVLSACEDLEVADYNPEFRPVPTIERAPTVETAPTIAAAPTTTQFEGFKQAPTAEKFEGFEQAPTVTQADFLQTSPHSQTVRRLQRRETPAKHSSKTQTPATPKKPHNGPSHI